MNQFVNTVKQPLLNKRIIFKHGMKQKPSDYKSHQMPEPIVLGHVTIIVPNLSLAESRCN